MISGDNMGQGQASKMQNLWSDEWAMYVSGPNLAGVYQSFLKLSVLHLLRDIIPLQWVLKEKVMMSKGNCSESGD